MGMWSKLRTVTAEVRAATYIDKHMKAAVAAGLWAIPGNTWKVAEGLVTAWREGNSALAANCADIKPVLLAAAALAHGIRHFNAAGRPERACPEFCVRGIA